MGEEFDGDVTNIQRPDLGLATIPLAHAVGTGTHRDRTPQTIDIISYNNGSINSYQFYKNNFRQLIEWVLGSYFPKINDNDALRKIQGRFLVLSPYQKEGIEVAITWGNGDPSIEFSPINGKIENGLLKRNRKPTIDDMVTNAKSQESSITDYLRGERSYSLIGRDSLNRGNGVETHKGVIVIHSGDDITQYMNKIMDIINSCNRATSTGMPIRTIQKYSV